MARPATDLRERILDAARAVFDRRGVDAASLREIARRARTTIGMIYYYYPTKDELYFAVVEATYAHVLEQFALLDGPGTLRDRLRALLLRLDELSQIDRTGLRVVAREMMVASPRRQRLIERFLHGHVPMIAAAVAGARVTGEVTSRASPVMVMFVIAALSAMSTLVLENAPIPGAPRGAARIDATLDLMFGGIAGG